MNKPWVKLPRNLPQYNHFVAGETKINHLTFLADIEKGDYKNAAKMILVRCDCGKELKLRKSEFAKGRAISCGCHRQTKISVGDEIGSWKLLEKSFIVYPGGRKQDAFICECVCGAIRTVDKYSLSTGTSKSCGCEAYKPDPNADTKHPLYNIWNGIMQRCLNPNSKNFEDYGAQGITICEEWRTFKGFASGILTLIGPRPSLEHSIDRIPNETGNYQPGQIKWSTRQEQMRNTRKKSFGIYNGQRMRIIEICELTGLKFDTARNRYHEDKEPPKRIRKLKAPVMTSVGLSHSKARTPEYRSWCEMRYRCDNPNHEAYDDYGGRGITYDQRWKVFKNFLEDMGLKPHPDYTIDRINNDGGYFKENCRWADWITQANNRRKPVSKNI